MYRGLSIYNDRGSVSFVLQFAIPPFPPPLPSVGQFSKQNRHRAFDAINTKPPVIMTFLELGQQRWILKVLGSVVASLPSFVAGAVGAYVSVQTYAMEKGEGGIKITLEDASWIGEEEFKME